MFYGIFTKTFAQCWKIWNKITRNFLSTRRTGHRIEVHWLGHNVSYFQIWLTYSQGDKTHLHLSVSSSGLLVIVLFLMLSSTAYDIFYTISSRKLKWFLISSKQLHDCNCTCFAIVFIDYCLQISGEKSQALLAFSVYSNGMKLLSYKQAKSAGMMHCLHGIRVISTIWVVYTHAYFMYIILPIRNKAMLISVCILTFDLWCIFHFAFFMLEFSVYNQIL